MWPPLGLCGFAIVFKPPVVEDLAELLAFEVQLLSATPPALLVSQFKEACGCLGVGRDGRLCTPWKPALISMA